MHVGEKIRFVPFVLRYTKEGSNERLAPSVIGVGVGIPERGRRRLIYANSNTRTMTSQEYSRQAEKVRELLCRLQEEGYDFPGRMRDHVAEACQISKSKLARLDAIQKTWLDWTTLTTPAMQRS